MRASIQWQWMSCNSYIRMSDRLTKLNRKTKNNTGCFFSLLFRKNLFGTSEVLRWAHNRPMREQEWKKTPCINAWSGLMPGVPECQHDHYLRVLTFDPRLPSFLFKLETMSQFTIDKIIAILETTSDAHTNWIRFYQLDFKFSLGNQINTQISVWHKKSHHHPPVCF